MSWVFKTGMSAAFATVTLLSSSSRAADFEVSGDVAAQGYEVASPWGDIVLGKRRLTTTLGLAAFNLQGDTPPFEGDYSIMMRLRVDNDFGVDAAERSFDAGDPTRFVPGMDDPPVDLMYGYVEGRDIADGWFGFRVGRQYVTDVLGWWNFDGAMLRVTTPFYLQAEVYGGLEQRAGAPLSTGRFESQGVWRGNHRGIRDRASDYPSYQFTGQAPAVGAAIESTGFSYLHVRWTWRRVYNTAPAFTRQFPAPGGGGLPEAEGLRLSSERFGGAATAYLSDVGALRAGFGYDFYSQFVNRGYAGLEFYPIADKLVLGIDAEYFRPTFDADSIWNWFTHNPVVDVIGRIAGRPVNGLELSASGGARLWAADGDPESWALAECTQTSGGDAQELQRCLDFGADPSLGADGAYARDDANRGTTFAPDILANAGASYRWSNGNVGVRGRLQNGVGGAATNRGRSGGGAIDAQQALVNDVLYVGGRVSAFTWSDPLRKDRDATSFGYMLAPEYQPHRVARMRFEWEHNINRLVGQRFRVLGLVSFRVEP